MLLNAFNSKINLPAILARKGIDVSTYQFAKLPLHGWYYWEPSTGQAGNIFDFYSIRDSVKVYKNVCQEYADCLDFKLVYTEHADKQLIQEHAKFLAYQEVWKRGVKDLREARGNIKGKTYAFINTLEDKGMSALVSNGAGYLSEGAINAYYPQDPDNHVEKQHGRSLVLPTFLAPGIVCSLECCKPTDIHTRATIYKNAEYGWFGCLGHEIVKNLDELKIKTGNTWNYKVDYWDVGPVKLSEHLDAAQLIKAWSESTRTEFVDDVQRRFMGKAGHMDLTQMVSMLTYEQVIALEKKSGQELLPTWLKTREQQFNLGDRVLIKRTDGYYMKMAYGEEQQLTNFTIEVSNVERVGPGNFEWVGLVFCMGQVTPFRLGDKQMCSSYRFTEAIRAMFFELGIGMPVIHKRYAPDVISLIQQSCSAIRVSPLKKT